MTRAAPLLAIALVAALLAAGLGAAPQSLVYADPQGRFSFSYPSTFGAPSRGTNDGFADRAAAIRFAAFSTEGVGGELVVTQGAPTLDLQAAGGLYDSIVRDALPERWRTTVVAALPRLTAANLCAMVGAATHLDAGAPALAPMPPPERARLGNLDRFGNFDPEVRSCTVDGEVVVFHKTARIAVGSPVRPVYGAIRFTAGGYSSVQIVRAAAPATDTVLEAMRQVVSSWRPASRD